MQMQAEGGDTSRAPDNTPGGTPYPNPEGADGQGVLGNFLPIGQDGTGGGAHNEHDKKQKDEWTRPSGPNSGKIVQYKKESFPFFPFKNCGLEREEEVVLKRGVLRSPKLWHLSKPPPFSTSTSLTSSSLFVTGTEPALSVTLCDLVFSSFKEIFYGF